MAIFCFPLLHYSSRSFSFSTSVNLPFHTSEHPSLSDPTYDIQAYLPIPTLLYLSLFNTTASTTFISYLTTILFPVSTTLYKDRLIPY